MAGSSRLQAVFDSGALVRPSAAVPNFVALVRSLLSLAGGRAPPSDPQVEELKRRIGHADRFLFVLIDGMGLSQVAGLPTGSFLRRHLDREFQAVFLSTTAAALTTLATAEWPAVHCVPGWWTRLDPWGVDAVALPFEERGTGRPLEELGVSARLFFPVSSAWPDLRPAPLSILPAGIVQSTYTRYATGGSPREGYRTLDEALAMARETGLGSSGRRLTYLYLPQLDSVSHEAGTGHVRTRELLSALDRLCAALCREVSGRVRVVITADHGQTDVPGERVFVLPRGDRLARRLRCQPSGEPSVPIFHVRSGQEEAFAEEFRSRLGEHFILLTPEEVAQEDMLGPGLLAPLMRERLGSFVGIPLRPSKLYLQPCGECHPEHVGTHGGLTAAEMQIPLILA